MADLDDAAIKTYRYLRIALIVLIVALAASVGLERAHASQLQDSISAYYYTPAHSVLVATLVGIGVCLIALKGCNDTEDLLLNIAGMLAPIVALVPTSEPSEIYGSEALKITKPRILIGNNVVALIIAGAVAVAVAYFVERSKRGRAIPHVRMVDFVGLGVALGLIVVGGVVYSQERETFLEHAHTVAAIAMFAIVGIVVVLNSRRAGREGKQAYARRYAAAAIVMASGVLVIVAHVALPDWKPWIFTLEAVEILGFAMFWVVQTFELWDLGVGEPMPVKELMRTRTTS